MLTTSLAVSPCLSARTPVTATSWPTASERYAPSSVSDPPLTGLSSIASATGSWAVCTSTRVVRRPKLVKVTAGGNCRVVPRPGPVKPVDTIASTAKRGPERPGIS